MLEKMVFKSKHFKKTESLGMKGNHPLVTYGGTFVIVLIARRKKFLKRIIPGERKDLPSKSSKKDMKQEIQKLTFWENPLESLIIMFFIPKPKRKPLPLPLHVKKIMTKTRNLY